MGFEISSERSFSAAHQLRLGEGVIEPLHGHNWRVRVTVSRESLDPIGVVMDFHELERLLDAIVMPMHNSHLNDLPAFAEKGGVNPTAENVAAHVGSRLELPRGVRLVSAEVWETPDCRAVWRP